MVVEVVECVLDLAEPNGTKRKYARYAGAWLKAHA